MAEDKKNSFANHHLTRAVLAFGGHVAAAVMIFVILAMAAFLLGKFVHLLDENGASQVLVTVLTGVEYAILATDVISVLFFLWNALKAAYKEFRV